MAPPAPAARALRIALQTRSFNGAGVHGDCLAAAEDAARLCESPGHQVEVADCRVDAQVIDHAYYSVFPAYLLAGVQARERQLGRAVTEADVEPVIFQSIERARSTTAAQYVAGMQAIHRLGREVSRAFQAYDAVLTPTMAVPPPPIGELALTRTLEEFKASVPGTVAFTQVFNLSGAPAMSVPLHWNATGLPIGVQFAGRYGEEHVLLRLAAQL
jgi:amidase